MERYKSFMYIRNMRGPNTDPWGTPSETGSKLDQEFLLKSTCDVNLLSKLSIEFIRNSREVNKMVRILSVQKKTKSN
jgi:hypothetical protein